MSARTQAPARVRKRDGRLVSFDRRRIAEAVARAAAEAGEAAHPVSEQIAAAVASKLARRPAVPTVEQIQDTVERELMAAGREETARRYVLYRRRRSDLRSAKRMLGVRDELKLSLNAAALLAERYLRRDEQDVICESTAAMVTRVAQSVAAAEEKWARGSARAHALRFARAMRALEFLPSSPTLMNAGTPIGQLSACYVLPVEDSLSSIFSALGEMALIHQAGGGTGFSFSRLRPAGDLVRSTHGRASGPVSFLRVFDTATEVVKEGGRRRGANMAVLAASHPDVGRLIEAKSSGAALQSFNISIAVEDSFMRAVEDDLPHQLVNPRTGTIVDTLPARALFDRIAEAAWRSGDPGLLFLERINADNPLPALGRIEATNPCGEVPLLGHESCNLGSINLARLVREGAPDWRRLRALTRLAVRFLDDVIEVNRYPNRALAAAARRTRKIGLGVMGLAELLAQCAIPYDSEQAIALADRIAATMRAEAARASEALARERGPFPAWPRSLDAAAGRPPRRNAQLLSIAPTGSISIIAGTTSGIEPMFALAYVRHVLGRSLTEVNATFERVARQRGIYREELMDEIAMHGGIRAMRSLPEDLRSAFVSALEIEPLWHLRMQGAFQRHVDGAVAKTVNLPADADPAAVREIYMRAWKEGVKGITVYRYGSKAGQVLSFLGERERREAPPVTVAADYAGGCAGHACEL
ncbi:MAG TPA: adenosylcobalamin-dependent ribonucleoside-diphosphate reductase [Solirubrobacteraceae bacterium]|nr:adenosylcobalamin-dependent ribonucleoside-diphosphate reductase [Solirubrobacteraceae bacterium]